MMLKVFKTTQFKFIAYILVKTKTWFFVFLSD